MSDIFDSIYDADVNVALVCVKHSCILSEEHFL